MLKRLLAIAQDILTHITEVDIQLSVIPLRIGERRIHHPEFDILDIGAFEIRIVQATHHTTPTLTRVGQLALIIDLRSAHVILSSLLRIVRQVQDRQLGVLVSRLLLIRIDLLLIHNTGAMVAQCGDIVADMRRGIGLRIAENMIDCIPCQQSAVFVIRDLVDILRLGKRSWCGSQEPITRIVNVNIGGCALKIIYICRSDGSHIVGMTRNHVGKLRIDLEGTRSGGCDPGDLVYGIGQPLHLRLIRSVDTPYRICQRLGAGIHLGRKRTLAQVHNGSTQHEVFGKLILDMRAKQRFALQRECTLVFQFDIHIGSALQYRLVEYGHGSHHIIHRIIHILYQFGATGSYSHTSSRHIHRTQTNLAAIRALIFTSQMEFVFLAHLLRYDQRRVIQLLETVFVHQTRVVAQLRCQVTTKRLQHREDNLSVRRIDRQPLHEIELTVRRVVVLRVQTVQVHHAQQLLAFDITLVEILHFGTHRVVAVHHIEFKLIAIDTGCTERIDILHHQVPCAASFLLRCIVGRFQQLQRQRIRRTQILAPIGGKLTHLIDLAIVGIFIRHGQHFILVQRLFERYVS